MIVIYGHRSYGRLGGHGGEYLVTKFAHLYWLPLVPTGSTWVTRELGNEQVLGFDVKLSGKSVAAAYLRMWAPLLAAIAVATMSVVGFTIAAVLGALSAWSWTWRRAVTGREARRALFNIAVFGTACDPLRRTRDQCDHLRAAAERGFAELSAGRTPNDVARFGAATPLQGAFAYGVLRVVAATAAGPAARKARDTSERILDGLKESDAAALGNDGPYRAPAVAADRDVAALESAASAAIAARDQAFVEYTQTRTASAWDNSPDNPAVQAEIAANKAKGPSRAIKLVLIIGVPLAVVGVGFAIWKDRRDAEQGMATLRQITDQLCACPDRACVRQVFDDRRDDIEEAEKDAADERSNRDDIEALAARVSGCLSQLPAD